MTTQTVREPSVQARQTSATMPTLLRPAQGIEKNWNAQFASHLLRRVQFGFSAQDRQQAVDEGYEKTVQRLMAGGKPSADFQQSDELLQTAYQVSGGASDLKAWWLYRMVHGPHPLLERMTLLWHNHFATSISKVQSVKQMADQHQLIRDHALGSFRKLAHGMSQDVAMLVWLDGNANRRRSPNENFARELMELFTLGVGNYTERDIKEAARAFTGWHVRRGDYWFNRGQHDTDSKTVFGKSGNLNGDDVVDLCLSQSACPRFLGYKILREFVVDDPTDQEIKAVAKVIRQNDFDMKKVMEAVLRSELFYSDRARAGLIKSPLDFLVGTFRTLGISPDLNRVSRRASALGLDLFTPPTVKGWEGGRRWINAAYVILRFNTATEILAEKFGKMPTLEKQLNFQDSNNPELVIEQLHALLWSLPMEQSVQASMVKYLSQGPSDDKRLRGVLQMFLTAPEYQLR